MGIENHVFCVHFLGRFHVGLTQIAESMVLALPKFPMATSLLTIEVQGRHRQQFILKNEPFSKEGFPFSLKKRKKISFFTAFLSPVASA